jgi:Zn-finger nucleic acid-binding protein
MRCPACELKKLKPAHIDKIGADVCFCKNCNGMWLSPDQVRAAMGEEIDNLSLDEARRSFDLKCLNCGKTLQAWKFPYTELEVGICKKCRGMWVNGRDAKNFVRAVDEIQEYGVPDQYKRRESFFKRVVGRVFG